MYGTASGYKGSTESQQAFKPVFIYTDVQHVCAHWAASLNHVAHGEVLPTCHVTKHGGVYDGWGASKTDARRAWPTTP